MRKLLLVLAIVIACMCVFGCTQPPAETLAPTETVPQTEPPTEEPTEPPTEPPTEEPMPQVLGGPLFPMGEVHIVAGNITKNYTTATVSIFWEDGEISAQTTQIRIRGQTSADARKKSYNIKFGQDVSIMGLPEGNKWSLLANHYDKSLLRNAVALSYASALGIPYTSEHRMCRLYLNGVYKGIYLLVEPIDIDPNRVEIDKDNGDFIIERDSFRYLKNTVYITTNGGLRFQMDDPDTMGAAERNHYLAVLNNIEAAIRTLDHTVYEKVIDVESFATFYVLHEFLKDIDFGRASTRYYVHDGVLYAGPPWDFDLSMGNVSSTHQEGVYMRYWNRNGYGDGSKNSASGPWVRGDFFQWLQKDPYFMDLVRQRWQETRSLAENLFQDNEHGQNLIDRYLCAYLGDLEGNFSKNGAGWSSSAKYSLIEANGHAKTYLGNVEQLRQWLAMRWAWVDHYLGSG